MELNDLIRQTKAEAGRLQALDLLANAARRQQVLAELGERLLDHFVQEARAAGCSWSQIGAVLGVTKQAAQQRHSPVRGLLGKLTGRAAVAASEPFERFTDRARESIVLAQDEARQLRHDCIGTEHLLLGLLAQGTGVAATALQATGIDLDRARAEVEGLIGTGCGKGMPGGQLPFTPRAKKVLELAGRQARDLDHDYIGTEHLLLGIVTEGEGVGAQLLTGHGMRLSGLRKTVLSLLAQGQ